MDRIKDYRASGERAAASISEVMDVQAQSIIIKVGAAAVEVQPGFDPSLLAAVIKTLKSVC